MRVKADVKHAKQKTLKEGDLFVNNDDGCVYQLVKCEDFWWGVVKVGGDVWWRRCKCQQRAVYGLAPLQPGDVVILTVVGGNPDD